MSATEPPPSMRQRCKRAPGEAKGDGFEACHGVTRRDLIEGCRRHGGRDVEHDFVGHMRRAGRRHIEAGPQRGSDRAAAGRTTRPDTGRTAGRAAARRNAAPGSAAARRAAAGAAAAGHAAAGTAATRRCGRGAARGSGRDAAGPGPEARGQRRAGQRRDQRIARRRRAKWQRWGMGKSVTRHQQADDADDDRADDQQGLDTVGVGWKVERRIGGAGDRGRSGGGGCGRGRDRRLLRAGRGRARRQLCADAIDARRQDQRHGEQDADERSHPPTEPPNATNSLRPSAANHRRRCPWRKFGIRAARSAFEAPGRRFLR